MNNFLEPAIGQAYSERSNSNRFCMVTETFQEFQRKQGKLSQEDIEYMIKLREKEIVLHQQKQKKRLDHQYDQNQISSRTYHHKRDQIEKWVENERKEVQR